MKSYVKKSLVVRLGAGLFSLAIGLAASTQAQAAPSPVGEAKPVDAKAIVKVEFFPPDVNLNTRVDRQRYVVLATRADGVTLDVTKDAQVVPLDAKLARVEQFTVYPTADGTTKLNVSYGAFKSEIPLVVKDATVDRPVSFHLDVMPVFMRSGCNTGSCHGAARGKDGFMLSLP